MQPEWQAHLDELMEQYKKTREQVQDLQERMAQIEVTHTTEDELITVKVGPQGRLVDLKFDPRVTRRMSTEELAAAVVAAVAAAADKAQEQVRGAVGSLVPPDGMDLSKMLPERPDDFEAVKEYYGFRDR